jgi:hypothetical protein
VKLKFQPDQAFEEFSKSERLELLYSLYSFNGAISDCLKHIRKPPIPTDQYEEILQSFLPFLWRFFLCFTSKFEKSILQEHDLGTIFHQLKHRYQIISFFLHLPSDTLSESIFLIFYVHTHNQNSFQHSLDPRSYILLIPDFIQLISDLSFFHQMKHLSKCLIFTLFSRRPHPLHILPLLL